MFWIFLCRNAGKTFPTATAAAKHNHQPNDSYRGRCIGDNRERWRDQRPHADAVGTVSDPAGLSTVSVQVFDLFKGQTVALTTATIDGSGNWTLTPTTPLSEGSHTFTAVATDAAGNTVSTMPVTVIVDTTPPSETITPTIHDAGLTTTIASNGVTKDNTLVLSGTVSDLNGVSSVHVFDGANDLGAATIDGSGNWSLTTGVLTDGTHNFTATATDTAGNATTTAVVTAIVDTVPPSETISSTIGTSTGLTATITSGGLTKDDTLTCPAR